MENLKSTQVEIKRWNITENENRKYFLSSKFFNLN